MTRLATLLCLGCLGAVLPIAPQLDDARLAVSAPPIVWIEAGTFVRGSSERDLDFAVDLCGASRLVAIPETENPAFDGACSPMRFAREVPQQRVWTGAYGIDRTEVTHARWRECVIRGRCPPARLRDDDARIADPRMPVAGVTWSEAAGFCAFAGGRLPTDDEWERAARGTSRNRFPWGRIYNDRLANHGRSPRGPDPIDGFRYAAPVGSFPDGASPYGLLDVAGNVWEWTASPPRDDDLGPGADPQTYRTIRGGSWAQPPEVLRVAHRAWQPVTESPSDLGLRCAYDAPDLARGGASAILRRP
ncbi:MAG: formylglycine-generating enzyme family protein [Myxococcales bacterium]|nr:formylglycine-generating enzyme family protein [Myxococcales bacterium]